ncbi:MAG: DUF928 domain-containing protein [Cyanothece sp. SIO1E1]|nr:DUF928 domain-containing protein [Cyanothece sp. SIO1E1]
MRLLPLLKKIFSAWAIALLLVSSMGWCLPARAAAVQSWAIQSTSVSLPGVSVQALAKQTLAHQQMANSPNHWLAQATQPRWRPPKGKQRPRRSFWEWLRGGGRRGSCSALEPPLMALLPAPAASSDESVDREKDAVLTEEIRNSLALTVSDHPRIWLYIPEQLRGIDSAEVMMQDEKGQDVGGYPLNVKLQTSGMVSFELPHALDLGQPYHWYFSVICNEQRPSRNPNVDGWVERVAPEQMGLDQRQLAVATPKEQIDLYAAKDIWYETLTLLAEQNCRNRQNSTFAEYWDLILRDIVPEDELDLINPLSYCGAGQKLQAKHPSPFATQRFSGQRQSPTKI